MPSKKDELEPIQPKNDSARESDAVEPAPKKPAAAKKPAAKPAESDSNSDAEDVTVADLASQAKAGSAASPVGATTSSTKSSPSKPKMTPEQMKSLVIKIVAVLVAVLAIAIIVFGVLIYAYKSENPAVKFASSVVPYPVQRVNGHFVSYHDYLFEVDANKRAYQNNAKLNNQPAVDYNTAEGKKLVKQIKTHALDKLKSDAVVAQLAKEKKVTVTDKDVDKLLGDLYKRYGGKDTLLKTLNQIYGWEINDLKKVVRKQLLAQKLQEKVTSDPALQAQAKSKAQDVLKKVKDGGDFAELAKKHSQASDASTGGDLGTVTKGQLPADMQKAVDKLEPGQVSDVVKTSYGYEVIKVIEKTADGGVRAQHIVTNTVNFTNYLNDKLGKAKVNTYVKV